MAKKKATNSDGAVKVEEPKPVEKKLTAKERLAAMSQKGTATTSEKKGVKPIISLPEGSAEASICDKLCAFSNVMDVAKTQSDTLKKNLKPIVVAMLIKQAAETGVMPDNPSVATKTSSVTFVAVDKSQSIKIPANPDGTFKSFRQWATERGIPEDIQATLLDKGEVTEREVMMLASPEKIEETGKPEDIELAEKMRQLLLDALDNGTITADEFKKISTTVVEIKFKRGFVDRAPGYAKVSGATLAQVADRLDKLLIKTDLVQSQFRSCDTTDANYAAAVVSVGSKELPEVADKDYTTDDKSHKMQVKGKEISIFVNSGATGKDIWGKVGTIAGTDSPHAHNKAAKMARDRKYLNEILQEIA